VLTEFGGNQTIRGGGGCGCRRFAMGTVTRRGKKQDEASAAEVNMRKRDDGLACDHRG